MKIAITCYLLLFILLSSCDYEDVDPGYPEYEIFDVSNSGLPTNFVTVLAIDNNSHLWIGTFDNGIVKYDGSEWTIHNTSNSGLSSDSVTSIAVDELNRIWVGTYDGVSMFDQKTWTIYDSTNSGMKGKHILALATDKQNRVWISSTGKSPGKSGLYLFDGVNWESFNNENSILPHYLVTALAMDRNNTLWIGTGMFQGKGGLIKAEGDDWQLYNTSNSSLKYDLVSSISFSRNNELLLSSPVHPLFGSPDELAGYLMTFDGMGNWTDLSPANQQLNLTNRVTASAYDNEDNIWLATSVDIFCATCNYALSKFDGEIWTIFSAENGNFPTTFISDIKIDEANTVWVAAGDVGLIKMIHE